MSVNVFPSQNSTRVFALLLMSVSLNCIAESKTTDVLYQQDFSEIELDQLPMEFLVLNGNFSVRDDEGNRLLTLAGEPKVQRKCKGCKDELEGKLQTKSVSSAGAMVITGDVAQGIQGLQNKGQPLPESERAFFEPRFGQDLTHVRINTGAQAAQTNASIGARAFTLGNNITFGQGEYQPNTKQGAV